MANVDINRSQRKPADAEPGGPGEEGALHLGQRVPHHAAGHRSQVSTQVTIHELRQRESSLRPLP